MKRTLKPLNEQLTQVLLTYNSASFLRRTLDHMLMVDAPIVAVDNGSTDDTVTILREYPQIELIELKKNIGAAARNYGVERAQTPYVAFCDDDTWYEQAGLEHGVELFEHHPHLGLITARILVGEEERLDPISEIMAQSPLRDGHNIPGAVLMSFMGGASLARKQAYLEAGGYDPKIFIGGEEELLGWKLIRRGWQMRYISGIICHHYPSLQNYQNLGHYGLRNTIWNAWLHRPARSAWHWTFTKLWENRKKPKVIIKALPLIIRGMPWVLRQRSVMPGEYEEGLQYLEFGEVKWPQAHEDGTSRSRLTPSPEDR